LGLHYFFKRPKLKGKIYYIDLKRGNNYKRKKMFIHSKEIVVRRDKIKYPPPKDVRR
jgi:hypothetical protein